MTPIRKAVGWGVFAMVFAFLAGTAAIINSSPERGAAVFIEACLGLAFAAYAGRVSVSDD